MSIWFSAKSPEWGWLSNLYPCHFSLDGLKWKSVEHYYQAQKHVGTAAFEAIRNAKDGFAALKAGGNRNLMPRGDWEQIKVTVMKKAVQAKFTEVATLCKKLQATGDVPLYHQSISDGFWGCNLAGEGDNRLGKLIMEVRAQLIAGG